MLRKCKWCEREMDSDVMEVEDFKAGYCYDCSFRASRNKLDNTSKYKIIRRYSDIKLPLEASEDIKWDEENKIILFKAGGYCVKDIDLLELQRIVGNGMTLPKGAIKYLEEKFNINIMIREEFWY